MPAQPPGVLNQNVTGAQAIANRTQALTIWTTPWGFVKGAAANNATVRQEGGQQVVSFSPANFKSPSGQAYTVTGYLNAQNLCRGEMDGAASENGPCVASGPR